MTTPITAPTESEYLAGLKSDLEQREATLTQEIEDHTDNIAKHTELLKSKKDELVRVKAARKALSAK